LESTTAPTVLLRKQWKIRPALGFTRSGCANPFQIEWPPVRFQSESARLDYIGWHGVEQPVAPPDS
jgi:hypothetical protein